METKTIKLSTIIIPNDFKQCIPNPKKFGRKLSYYKWTKRFDAPIIIDSENTLLDGYMTYLIAKMFDVEDICVNIS